MEKNISRRSFLKGTAIGAAGIAAATAGLKLQSGKAEDAIAWDAEYDVVVLGFGGAGANAAVAAYENGAKVLLAEKAPEGAEGGNTAVSGQFVMSTDDADGLYDYLTTLMGKFQNWDPEAVRAYCEGCVENYAWMTGPMGGDPEIISPTEHPSPDRPVQAGPERLLVLQLGRVPGNPLQQALPVPDRDGFPL